MSLEQQISKGIMEAMKAKDTVRLGALRNAKKYIIEAKTAGPEITELPDADVLKIISKLAKQGTDSAAIFTEQNRPDLAAEEPGAGGRISGIPAQAGSPPRRACRRGQGRDRRGRRDVDEGDGQGDGRRFEEARRPCRRQGYLGQGQGVVGVGAADETVAAGRLLACRGADGLRPQTCRALRPALHARTGQVCRDGRDRCGTAPLRLRHGGFADLHQRTAQPRTGTRGVWPGDVGRFRRPSSCDHLCPGAVSPDGRGDLLRPAGDRAARQAPISSAVWASTALRAAICCAASSCGCPMPTRRSRWRATCARLGGFRCRGGARIHFAGNAPVIAVRVGSGKSRMKTYMKFDTGSGALFDCRYDECRAMIEKGILQEVRRTEGHSGNLGWTNRSVVGEAVRGVIPEFVLAGNTLAGMPLEVTHGGHSKARMRSFPLGNGRDRLSRPPFLAAAACRTARTARCVGKRRHRRAGRRTAGRGAGLGRDACG